MCKAKWKLIVAGAFVACIAGAFVVGRACATPGNSISFTPIVGPAVMGGVDTYAETDDWEAEIRIRGLSDVYVTTITIKPGGFSGWHSHPGPSFIAVKSGELTLYDDCVDPTIPYVFPAGSALVEDAGCVHIVVNEGDTDLVFTVVQIVPLGARRLIDEPAP